MTILVKNKETLKIDEFQFKCCVGKKGFTYKKKEGDKKTPIGTFSLGRLYYRKDRVKKPITKLKCIAIKKNMGWCNDTNLKNKYNRLIVVDKKISHEKLFRNDYKYNYIITINYNTNKIKLGKGSAIFLHLTKNYKPTAGCVALNINDFLILLKLIKPKTKIKIL